MTLTGTLQPDLINRLQQLVIANQNSFDSLKCAANQLNQKPYWSVVFDIAFQRGLHADILSRILALGGVKPEENGSTAAVDESVWAPLRNVAPQDGPEAILEKAEQSEEHLKQLYADAIDQGQS